MSDRFQGQPLAGDALYAMLTNGYRNLLRNMTIIDELNVFPVPDGDTGKNMSRTLSGGVEGVDASEKDAGVMMKKFTRGTLMTARGNSGVISSQIYRGLGETAKGKATISIADFMEMMNGGVKRSYASVPNAVEGTILTVMREGTEWSTARQNEMTDWESCLQIIIEEMQKSLRHTPEYLPVLKDAGVVDSGGAGLVCVFEGMLMYVQGQELSDEEEVSYHMEDFHIEKEAVAEEHRHYVTIAVVNGEGLKEYFLNGGIDYVIDGGQTSNPSTGDFIQAFERFDADYIIVLPSNSNIIMTAEQAAQMYKKADVRVVHTKSIAESFSSMSLIDLDIPEIEDLLYEMTYYLPNVTTGYVTTATRDTMMNGVEVKEGHYIGLTLDAILSDSEDKFEAAIKMLHAIPQLSEKQVITVFYGKDVTDEEAEQLQDMIYAIDPMLDVGMVNGGQDVYSFIMAIE